MRTVFQINGYYTVCDYSSIKPNHYQIRHDRESNVIVTRPTQERNHSKIKTRLHVHVSSVVESHVNITC